MPALDGQIIMTLRNDTGGVVIEATISYVPATGAFRNVAVNTSDGVKNGAVVVDNRTNRAVRCVVATADGTVDRTVNIPRNGVALTVAQLSAQGITQQPQLNGLTFDLA